MSRALRALLLLASLIVSRPVIAQLATGSPPFSSSAGGPDQINLANLNVHIAIPVLHRPGRGSDFGYDLTYDGAVWYKAPSGASTVWTPVSMFGWKGQTEAGIGYLTYKSHGGFTCPNPDYPPTLPKTVPGFYFDTYVYHDRFGASHPFNITVYTAACGGSLTENLSTDGSGYDLQTDGSLTNILTAPDGTQTTPPTSPYGVAGTKTDRNGNQLTVNASNQFFDTLSSTTAVLTVAGSGTPASPLTFTYAPPSGPIVSYTMRYTSYSVQTAFACSGVVEYGPTTTNLVSEIDLPDGAKYIFSYEATPGVSGKVTGRIASVRLPTGGTISYSYSGGSHGITCADGSTATLTRTTPDGTWIYAQTKGSGAASTTTVTDPASNDTQIQFQGIYETERKAYHGAAGGTPLQTVDTCYNAATIPCTGTAITLPITQRTVVGNLPSSGQQSKHVDFWNTHGQLTESDEYDFGSSGVGSLIKKTLITYGAYGGGLFTQSVKIQDGAGTVKYRQDTTYDSYGGGLVCVTGAPHHNDTSYGCSFTARGNPTSVTTYTNPSVPSGGITKNFTYDSVGNLRTAQLNCCQLKTFNFNSTYAYAFPNSAVSGSSSPTLTTSFTYDMNMGLPLSSTDPNNLTTTLTYDNMGRPLTATVGSNPAITYTYNDYDNSSGFTAWKVTVCSPVQSTNTVCQKSVLDSQGRTATQQLLDGSATLYSATDTQYDTFGRPYRTSNPYTVTASYFTETSFDDVGRLKSTKLPDNSTTSYSYTDATVTTTDPASIQRKMQSDALGRLVSVWEPDPSSGNSLTLQTTYSYSVLDQLTGVTQGSQSRSYVYDALGRLTSTTTPEAGLLCFGTKTGSTCNSDGYDSFNNLLYRTDARGVLTSYSYDTLNRLYNISYNVGSSGVTATPSVTLTYGTTPASFNNGRLITMTDGPGSENYTYNAFGQVTQLQKIISSTTYNIGYSYNYAGELTSITYPSNRVVQQNVDTIGRLCSVGASSSGCLTGTLYASAFSYNAAQLATDFRYGNGIYASYGFSADRLLLTCLDYSTTNRSGTCTHDGTTKFGLSYTYPTSGSNNGQIASITDSVDNGRSATYGYDALYRLTSTGTTGSTGYPAWGLSFVYDRYGNRTSQNVTAGTGVPSNSVSVSASTNQITTSGYAYDSDGNMTNDGSNTLVYDAESRVLSASNGGASGAYVLDGNNLRVKRCLPNCTSPTTTVVYIFSGGKVIAEYDNGAAVGSPSREYIYGSSGLLAKIDSSGTNYYHQDHLSNRIVTNSSGTATAQIGHYPFGESWYNSTGNKLLFTSYERDSESSNDFAIMRTYISRLARFSVSDPLAGSVDYPQSLNRYAYAVENPINLVDPSGMDMVCLQNLEGAAVSCYDSTTVTASDPGLGIGFGGGAHPGHGLIQDVPEPPNLGRGVIDNPPPPPTFVSMSQPPPPPVDACDPYMIALFRSIWNQTIRFPDRQQEAGNRVDLTQRGFTSLQDNILGPIVKPGPGTIPSAAIPTVPGQTVAIVHSHPAGTGRPSGQDRTSPYPNFVVSQFAVYVTDPRNPTPQGDREVRGRDWADPCPGRR